MSTNPEHISTILGRVMTDLQKSNMSHDLGGRGAPLPEKGGISSQRPRPVRQTPKNSDSAKRPKSQFQHGAIQGGL